MKQPTFDNFFKVSLHVLTLVLFVGIYYSMLFMSMSIIGLSILSLLRLYLYPESRSQAKSKVFFSYSILFFLVVLSGFNSSNHSEWLHQIQMKLAFLGLPLAFYTFQDHFKRFSIHYITAFIGIAFISLIPVIKFCFDNAQEAIEKISRGQSVPTPIDHLKYSLSLCIASILSIYIYLKKLALWGKIPRMIYLFIGLLIIVSLHVIAVRSGLVLLYLGLFVLLINHLASSKHKIRYAGLIICLLSLPFVAYLSVPNFQKKVQYSLYDFNMYLQGDGKDYSDSERMYGYSAAIELIRKHPIFGTGIGDLREEITAVYLSKYNYKIAKYPHNQYLFYLAGIGVIGLLVFLLSLLAPLFLVGIKGHAIFYLTQLLFLTSFLVENVLERSYGAVLFLIISLLTIQFSQLIMERKEELRNSSSH